jgi:hypothetical protein
MRLRISSNLDVKKIQIAAAAHTKKKEITGRPAFTRDRRVTTVSACLPFLKRDGARRRCLPACCPKSFAKAK